jgi:hypothetical protein
VSVYDEHEKTRRVLDDPEALAAEMAHVFRYFDPAERGQFDVYDMLAHRFLHNHGIESSDGDWEDETRKDLAGMLRAVSAKPRVRGDRELARQRAEQADICPECRCDASVPHLTGCSRGAFPCVDGDDR